MGLFPGRQVWFAHHEYIKLIQASEGRVHGIPEGQDEADSSEGTLSTRQRLQIMR